MDDTRIAASKGAMEGALFARYEPPESSFRAAFLKRYGTESGVSADTGYDAVMSFARAVDASGAWSGPALAAAILPLHFEGASGPVSFDAAGGVVKTPVLYQVRGDSAVPFGE